MLPTLNCMLECFIILTWHVNCHMLSGVVLLVYLYHTPLQALSSNINKYLIYLMDIHIWLVSNEVVLLCYFFLLWWHLFMHNMLNIIIQFVVEKFTIKIYNISIYYISICYFAKLFVCFSNMCLYPWNYNVVNMFSTVSVTNN